jgi:hypothetical protein
MARQGYFVDCSSGKARQGEARLGAAWRGMARLGEAGQGFD